MNKYIYLFIIFIFFTSSCVKDIKNNYIEDKLIVADKLYKRGNFKKAFEEYKKIRNKNSYSENIQINFKLAEAAFKIKMYNTALYYYKKISLKILDQTLKDFVFVKYELCNLYLKNTKKVEQDLKDNNNIKISELFFLTGEYYYIIKKYDKSLNNFIIYYSKSTNYYLKNKALIRIASIFKQRNLYFMGIKYFKKIEVKYLDKDDIYRYNKLKLKLKIHNINEKDGLVGNSISVITFDNDDVWIGTWLSGISRINFNIKSIKNFKAYKGKLLANYIRDIKIYSNDVWVATYDGISKYNKISSTWQNYIQDNTFDTSDIGSNPRIKSILKYRNKIYFASLGKGLKIYDIKKMSWEYKRRKNKFFSDFLVYLYQYKKNIYICSLDKGVAIYNTDRKKYYYINKKSGLTDLNIRRIIVNKKFIYVATKSKGIFVYDKRLKLKKIINSKHNLSSNYITDLILVKNYLICSTMDKGINIINLKTDKIKYLRVIDGLSSDSISTLKYQDGFLWIGYIDKGIDIYLTDF